MDFVVGESRLRLIELRLIDARIYPGEHVAFLDRLTFLEVDADQQSGDLTANGRGVESRDRSQAGQDDGHVALLDCRCDDGNRFWRGTRRLRLAIPPRIEDAPPPGRSRTAAPGSPSPFHLPPITRFPL